MKDDAKELGEFMHEQEETVSGDALSSDADSDEEVEVEVERGGYVFGPIAEGEGEPEVATTLAGLVAEEGPTEREIWDEEAGVEETVPGPLLEVAGLELEEMIDDPVRMYLREMGRVSLLSAREEKVLASSTSTGSSPQR
jgi:hypothetical protein